MTPNLSLDSIDFDKDLSNKLRPDMSGALAYEKPIGIIEDSSAEAQKSPSLHLVLKIDKARLHKEHRLYEFLVKPKPSRVIILDAEIISSDHPKPHFGPDKESDINELV